MVAQLSSHGSVALSASDLICGMEAQVQVQAVVGARDTFPTSDVSHRRTAPVPGGGNFYYMNGTVKATIDLFTLWTTGFTATAITGGRDTRSLSILLPSVRPKDAMSGLTITWTVTLVQAPSEAPTRVHTPAGVHKLQIGNFRCLDIEGSPLFRLVFCFLAPT